MAWMRMMGRDSVEYHRSTVLGRSDDHPGLALAYYASRGETPLSWGGAGAVRLGLSGPVTEAQYEAVFGPGGARDPSTGTRLASPTRPGMELVVSAHKSVALLGVLGWAEDMHAILDAERDATLAYLDRLTLEQGGRRGRAAVATETSGLIYAVTRHATTRAGDPGLHDHVLLANVVEMLDAKGGWKAAHTALWRDHCHAATAYGRIASARVAVELGYAIQRDDGPSGKLGHWAIAGLPYDALAVHSKRSTEIDAHCEAVGHSSYRARNIAARDSRAPKEHEPVGELLPRWRAELGAAGYPVEDLVHSVRMAAFDQEPAETTLAPAETTALLGRVLDDDGDLARRKVFSRRDVVVAVAPSLFGRDPAELDRVVARALADPEAVPLLGVPGASERAYSLASVLAVEQAIADGVERGTSRADAARVDDNVVASALDRAGTRLGHPLTAEQRNAVAGICAGGAGIDLVIGVAGSGKTTVVGAAADAFAAEGFRVLGTATSGQAARTLGDAGLAESRTLASLLWRLDHGRLELDERTVVVLDESGMTEDTGMLRLLVAAEEAGSKVVLVGDDRQLGSVGPGGALRALVERHDEAVHVLGNNLRQSDPAEREALVELRAGDVERAVAFYAERDRIVAEPELDWALDAVVAGWAVDRVDGHDTAMFAWRRANVEELNRRAREHLVADGWLNGPEFLAPGARSYAVGDRIVTLAPGVDGGHVTSERGWVVGLKPTTGQLQAVMDDGRSHLFERAETAADRLAYGYAVTVHRSQGATVERAHVLADGGGRELGYVAMSRSTGPSFAYVVADDVDQAKEDLVWDWSDERRQQWSIDVGAPGPAARVEDGLTAAKADAVTRAERLRAERAAVAAAIPADPLHRIVALSAERSALQQDREDLQTGRGRWEGTDAGRAANDLREAQAQRYRAEQLAKQRDVGILGRWDFRRHAAEWAGVEAGAQQRWDSRAAPEAAHLDGRIDQVERQLDGVVEERDERDHWLQQHPEVEQRLAELDAELGHLEQELAPAAFDPTPETGAAALPGPGLEIGRDGRMGLGW